MAKRGRGTLSLFPKDRSEGLLTDASIVHVERSGLRLSRSRKWRACWPALSLWQDLQLDLFWSELLGVNRKGTSRWQEARLASRSSCWHGTRTLRPCPEPRPRRQGASDPSAAAEAAVGPGQATLDHVADARGAADENRHGARSVSQGLAAWSWSRWPQPVPRSAAAYIAKNYGKRDRGKASIPCAIISSINTRLSYRGATCGWLRSTSSSG
jgi:hypothetical protein